MPKRHRIPLPQKDVLDGLLSYDASTGVLVWALRQGRRGSWNSKYAGKRAGHRNLHGYVFVKVNDVGYHAHRIIWKMVHGVDPDHIDHINGDRSDNRLINLRNVTASENQHNRKLNNNNSTGHPGIHWCQTRRAFVARITNGGRMMSLGRFETVEAAISARRIAEQKFNFSETHGRA